MPKKEEPKKSKKELAAEKAAAEEAERLIREVPITSGHTFEIIARSDLARRAAIAPIAP